jgi:2,3-diketo-5-methylthio-1-phosphopentane phosphatase
LRSTLLSNNAVTHYSTPSQHHLTDRSTGNLWKTGYSKGELKTPLFNDVIPTLETWKNAGKTLAIFSSGSVQAQLQFFSYVENGSSTRDLKPLFTAHFDTVTAGSKLEQESYVKICREMGFELGKVTFLTDNVNGMFALYSIFSLSPSPSIPLKTFPALHPIQLHGLRHRGRFIEKQ